MEQIKITRQMLNQGMQGRIKIKEVDRFNKEVKNFNLEPIKEKLINEKSKEKNDNFLNKILSMDAEVENSDTEDMEILKQPKLRKVRSYRGWN